MATMSLHTDIPTRAQIDQLLTSRNAPSVSIYLPADPASADLSRPAAAPR
jgi:hypothetical protein